MNIDDLINKLARERARRLESLIVERVEEHLGRVPTDAEVAANGKKVMLIEHPNEEHYYWGKQRLFSIVNGKYGQFEVF